MTFAAIWQLRSICNTKLADRLIGKSRFFLSILFQVGWRNSPSFEAVEMVVFLDPCLQHQVLDVKTAENQVSHLMASNSMVQLGWLKTQPEV